MNPMNKFAFDLQRFATSAAVVTSKNPADLSIPAGEWSFKNFNRSANPYQVFRTLGHCSEATQTWNVNTVEKRDATRGTRELIAQAETQRDLSLTITMDQWDPVNVALACWGDTAIKHIEAKTYSKSFVVSPGDELYLLTDDEETPAYNYKNLTITRATSTAAAIKAAVLDSMGGMTASTGSVTSGGTYTGTKTEDYYVLITKSNSVAGTITDAEFVWKKGLAGSYSAPTVVTGTAQTLSDGVTVTFAAGSTGTDFVVGDEWKIAAVAAGGALIEGQDYSADDTDVMTGKVRIATDSTIGIDEIVNVTYDVPEQYIPRVFASTHTKIEGELRFQADPTIGRRLAITYYHVKIAPNGDLTLIGEDFASQQVTATVISDVKHASKDNPDSRYYHVDYVGETSNILVKE